MTELEELILGLEEVEALRLADMESLSMEEAAAMMKVSRHTFGRIVRRARQTVATALVQGCALRLEGGHFTVLPQADGRRRDVPEAD